MIHEDQVASEFQHTVIEEDSNHNEAGCEYSKRDYPQTFECIVCYKEFQSESTLKSHLLGQRHVWLMTKALDEMTFIKNKGKLKRRLSTQYPSEDEYDNDDVNSSEEGYCTDENKMPTEFDANNNNVFYSDNCGTTHKESERRGSRIGDRTRRKKMEELKEVYKQYALDRGSSDLYEIMVNTYEDFHEEKQNSSCLRRSLSGKKMQNSRTSPCNQSKKLNENEALMKRDMVLKELVDTETGYVEDLGFVVNEFIPLLDEQYASHSLKQNFEIIFGNIEEIYKFHAKSFLKNIEECTENPKLLKQTFCNYEDELSSLYSQYCKCKPSADEALMVHEDELEIIRKKNFPSRKLTMKDYLVKPVQRLMKYQLLLNSVMKYSLTAGISSISYLQCAIKVMERVPKEANDALNVELIQGYEGFLPSTDLIFQEVLNVTTGKTKTKARSMRVFVFENVIIFTDTIKRIKRLPEYKYLSHGKTSCMGITEIVENDVLKFAVWFRKYKTTDIYVCQAQSAEVKESWMQVLKDVIAIQAILQNRVSRYCSTFRETMHDEDRIRSRSRTTSDIVVEETLRQKMVGHPRIDEMSEKLKLSIERYLLEDLLNKDGSNTFNIKERSKSLASSLVSKSDMKPICRLRSGSADIQLHRKPQSKNVKETLVGSVTHVSFGVLDPT